MRAKRAKEINKTKVTILVIVVILLIIGIFSIIYVKGKNENNEIIENTYQLNKNEIKKENIIEPKENKVENEVEENIIEENNEIISSEVITEPVEKQEEKAIQIAKKDFGTESGVYYSNMGIDAQGRFIVTVNVSATTEVIQWYYIDVTTGKFEKQ